jgi:hypothetical protein
MSSVGERRLQAETRITMPRASEHGSPIVQNGLAPVFVDVQLVTTTPI